MCMVYVEDAKFEGRMRGISDQNIIYMSEILKKIKEMH